MGARANAEGAVCDDAGGLAWAYVSWCVCMARESGRMGTASSSSAQAVVTRRPTPPARRRRLRPPPAASDALRLALPSSPLSLSLLTRSPPSNSPFASTFHASHIQSLRRVAAAPIS